MALDGIVISNIVAELNSTILNSKISKIAEPEADELLLTLKGPNGSFRLSMSRYPEVFAMEEQPVDEDELWSSLEKALRGAFEPFVESRVREGENLKKDLCEKLDNMVSYVDLPAGHGAYHKL
jgi:uncharacterized protein YicC (UPF0701 family)